MMLTASTLVLCTCFAIANFCSKLQGNFYMYSLCKGKLMAVIITMTSFVAMNFLYPAHANNFGRASRRKRGYGDGHRNIKSSAN